MVILEHVRTIVVQTDRIEPSNNILCIVQISRIDKLQPVSLNEAVYVADVLLALCWMKLPNCPFFPYSSVEISLKDWDMKEQENLRDVENILDRTDEILEVRHVEWGCDS